MTKDPKIFLKHVLESIKKIEDNTEKISEEEFLRDTKTQDALSRRIEIIGEAVKNLPSDFKEKHPEIEWREISAMRDKLIHHYFGIDMSIVWETSKKDLPRLKKQISKILESLEKSADFV